MRLTHGTALTDVLDNLIDPLLDLDINTIVLGQLIDKVAQIQARLANGSSEKIQILALIAAFLGTREALDKEANDAMEE